MPGLTRQGCHKTVSALLLPFVDLPDRAYLGLFGTESSASHECERTRGKGTGNMERNVSRHHKKLNASKLDRIATCIRVREVQQGITSSILLRFSLK
ncbi:hypothetical protein TNCV_3287381 [Trichonephila clavipes]|nr:hypothetical protein TNCV_3287381 [Trichonephila clavipes]